MRNKNCIWKKIVDSKYKTDKPNVLCCPKVGASPFWKGVLWAMQAAIMGIKWIVGDGKKNQVLGGSLVGQY